MKKLIKGNDVYFLQVLENKIIINNNYEGIIVLDYELNVLAEIKLLDGICIYSSFNIGKNELILFCPENGKVVYVNIENLEVNVMDIPSVFLNEILNKVIFNNKDFCVFVTMKNKYIVLDKNNKKLENMNDKVFDKKIIKSEKDISAREIDILQKHQDCNNKDVKNGIIVITYENEILVYNEQEIKEIFPIEGYIFNNAKIIDSSENTCLIVLGNNKQDTEISIVSKILL